MPSGQGPYADLVWSGQVAYFLNVSTQTQGLPSAILLPLGQVCEGRRALFLRSPQWMGLYVR